MIIILSLVRHKNAFRINYFGDGINDLSHVLKNFLLYWMIIMLLLMWHKNTLIHCFNVSVSFSPDQRRVQTETKFMNEVRLLRQRLARESRLKKPPPWTLWSSLIALLFIWILAQSILSHLPQGWFKVQKTQPLNSIYFLDKIKISPCLQGLFHLTAI